MKYKLFPPQAIYELGQRSNQEDNIFPAMGQATADDRLFIVCDGMGGHEHGEVASQAVATTIGQTLTRALADEPCLTDDSINRAISAAYDRLDLLDRGEARKMGTTLTLLCLHQGGVTAAHIGDSRIYHLRPATGEVRYLSRDHSLVMDLYQAGEITRDEMRTSPQKNVITRAMTPGKDDRTRADIVHIADVQPGDYFYLCSDGMLEQMEDDGLLALVSDNTTDSEKREVLIRATIVNKDNHSAYLIHVEQVTREQGDEALADDEMTTRYNAMNIYREREAQDASDVSIVAPPKFRPREITVDATGAPSSTSPSSGGTEEGFKAGGGMMDTSSPPKLGTVGGGMTAASAATGGGMRHPNGLLSRKSLLIALAVIIVLALAACVFYFHKLTEPTSITPNALEKIDDEHQPPVTDVLGGDNMSSSGNKTPESHAEPGSTFGSSGPQHRGEENSATQVQPQSQPDRQSTQSVSSPAMKDAAKMFDKSSGKKTEESKTKSPAGNNGEDEGIEQDNDEIKET